MAILIPDMDMPKNCMECRLNYDQIGCSVTGSYFYRNGFEHDTTKRMSNCPLIELNQGQTASLALKDMLRRLSDDLR